MQPEILRRVLGSEHKESGLAARLLVAFPPQRTITWSDADVSERVEVAYERVIHGLLDLSPATDGDGRPVPIAIPLSTDARKRFIQWHDQHRAEQAELAGVLSGHWSKLVAYCARLGLIIQLVREQSGEASGSLIDLASIDAA